MDVAIDRECPKCGAPMELEDPDPDCGIEGGWICTDEGCGHTELYEIAGPEPWDEGPFTFIEDLTESD
jgi:hypothetical protein